MKLRTNPRLNSLSSSVGSSVASSFDLNSPAPSSVSSNASPSNTPATSPCYRQSPFDYKSAAAAVPIMSTAKRYTIEPMTPADADEVIVFLRTFFFKDEPLNQSLDLGDCPELERWSVKNLDDLCSFKAVNAAGEIIGLIINSLLYKNKAETVPEDVCRHKQFNAILEMIEYVGTQFDLFACYAGHERGLESKVMSVSDAYRGCGIAQQLTRRTIEHMLELDLHLYHVMCTSQYSALVCERMGMEEIYTLNYGDYNALGGGRHPLNPAEPHGNCRLYGMIV